VASANSSAASSAVLVSAATPFLPFTPLPEAGLFVVVLPSVARLESGLRRCIKIYI
jgi:hypothetical protein